MVSFVTDLWSAAVHGGKQRRQVTIRIYTIFCWSKVCLCFYLCEATKDEIPLYPLSCNTRKESFLLVKCLWHDHPFRKILYNRAFEYSRFFSLIAAGNVRARWPDPGQIHVISIEFMGSQTSLTWNVPCSEERVETAVFAAGFVQHNEQYHRIVHLFCFCCLPFHTKPYFRPKFRLQIQICFFNLHRNCIGMNFAMAEMRVAVAMILRRLACLRLK